MLFWFFVIAVAFVTFCATPLGSSLFQKLENYNRLQVLKKLDENARFSLQIDDRGKIISVYFDGYGIFPIDTVKKYQPKLYQKIMLDYDFFKRNNN